jgi:hypothetical protein
MSQVWSTPSTGRPTPIRWTGQLLRHARTSTGVDGSAWLTVELAQPNGPLPAEARKCFGKGNAASYVAAHAAMDLRKGETVTIHAGFADIVLSPTPHFLLLDVDLIERMAVLSQRERYGS